MLKQDGLLCEWPFNWLLDELQRYIKHRNLMNLIPSEARFINLSRVDRTTRQKLELRYFYRSLGCPQLTPSPSDVGCVGQWSRVNFHL